MKPKVFIVSVIFFLLTCFAKCQTVAIQQNKKDTLVKPNQVEQYPGQCHIDDGWYCKVAYREINCVVAGIYLLPNTTYRSTISREDYKHMAK
jgi:hypothetical protein